MTLSNISSQLETTAYSNKLQEICRESCFTSNLALSTDEIFPFPHEPGISSYYSLYSISNEGKALLSRNVKNEQLVSSTQFLLFDTELGTLTRVRQPNLGNESIYLLSTQNLRLLGSGPKPFQITYVGKSVSVLSFSDEIRVLWIRFNPETNLVIFVGAH